MNRDRRGYNRIRNSNKIKQAMRFGKNLVVCFYLSEIGRKGERQNDRRKKYRNNA